MPLLNAPTFQADLEDSVEPVRPLRPELFWPSLELSPKGGYTIIDSPTCPTEKKIIEKKVRGNYRSPTFWATMETTKEAYILDRYFHPPAMEMLYNSINKNPFITGIHLLYGDTHIRDVKFIKYKGKLQRLCEQKECNLELKEHYHSKIYPYIHDRFVLADNELWHFGVHVGGGYEGLSAISRGWEGQASKFKTLFQKAFNSTPAS